MGEWHDMPVMFVLLAGCLSKERFSLLVVAVYLNAVALVCVSLLWGPCMEWALCIDRWNVMATFTLWDGAHE